MIIKDIIENDNDRLFIVDNECYIVFTGDSLEDEKPFIRIGNWLDLYVEIIPLIENIIITDNISGNPLHEQFNIDIQNLHHNRYIGSENTLRKFLDFQRLCGLDLKNASIVNIEKDIPEITGKRLISKKNQFIGVFYRNSNFKVIYNKNDIVSLYDAEKISYSHKNIMDTISAGNRNRSFHGTGIYINRERPLLYSSGKISILGFPENLFMWLVEQGVDPENIESLVLPVESPHAVIDLLKWKQGSDDGINIYSDAVKETEYLKNLFNRSINKADRYTSMDALISGDINLINFKGSGNLIINYTEIKPRSESVKISYITEDRDIDELIKTACDGILITYSQFENSSMRLKSTDIPVAVIDDGNPNISRLFSPENIIIFQNMEYEILKTGDIEYLFERLPAEHEILGAILENSIQNIDEINEKLNNIEDELTRNTFRMNLVSFFRIIINSTSDRKLSSKLKNLFTALFNKTDREILKKNSRRIRGSLIFHNNGIYHFYTEKKEMNSTDKLVKMIYAADEYMLSPASTGTDQNETYDFNSRIIYDRERLRRLLDYFMEKSKMFLGKKDYIVELDTLLRKRRKEHLIKKPEGKGYDVSIQLKEKTFNQYRKTGKKSNASEDKEKEGKKVSAQLKILITIITLLLVSAVIYFTGHWKNTPIKESEAGHVAVLKEIRIIEKGNHDSLIKKYNIRIRASDILRYANSVAQKNNYNKISLSKLREKNPDWIYPGNVFLLPDNSKVEVRKGDTLWNLSEKKLIENSIIFNRLIEKLNDPESRYTNELLDEAKKIAFIEKHVNLVNRLLMERKGSNGKIEKK